MTRTMSRQYGVKPSPSPSPSFHAKPLAQRPSFVVAAPQTRPANATDPARTPLEHERAVRLRQVQQHARARARVRERQVELRGLKPGHGHVRAPGEQVRGRETPGRVFARLGKNVFVRLDVPRLPRRLVAGEGARGWAGVGARRRVTRAASRSVSACPVSPASFLFPARFLFPTPGRAPNAPARRSPRRRCSRPCP